MAILERRIIHDVTTLCSHISYPRFVLPLHKHVEFEIMLFTRGTGKQFVGEGVSDFKAGDIVLIGSNVPHLHLCDAKLHPQPVGGGEAEWCAGEAIQFSPELFPENMEAIPDYRFVYDLLRKSPAFDASEYTRRVICLLQMLERLRCCKRVDLLSDVAYSRENRLPGVKEPVDMVYAYLYNHFQEKVTLEELAVHVKQNPAALCRHFKRRADKSIFQCLAEIRIGHACKLLAYSEMNVSQVAYESGYNSVTHFISQFEKLVRRTPSEYRAQIRSS